MSIQRTAKTSAFGIEEGLPSYRLRQARYYALGQDVARLASDHHRRHRRPLDLLDVGCDQGIAMRYIEAHPGSEHVRYHGADLFPRGMQRVYKREQWRLTQVDLEQGLGLDSNAYDVVVCEQVLEHLHKCQHALTELVRVLRPGGLLIVGVPIFPFGLHVLRRHLVPRLDRWLNGKKIRGHVQAFSKRSFLQVLDHTGELEIEEVRGFRFISGGPLRPLEYCRWWWQLNRRLGRMLPSLCTEIQVFARKQPATLRMLDHNRLEYPLPGAKPGMFWGTASMRAAG
jgi:2-polyprenyl-3-methyl-5-hydroxy-6-metoxy-1,4-benzoquinol methylase